MTECSEEKTVTVEKAKESCYRFWQWCNSSKGHPEHYPDEEVVRFLMGLRSRCVDSKALMVLDLASGSGKNAVAIAELGFQTHCVDWSRPGLDYTIERLKGRNLEVKTECVDFSKEPLPYKNGIFDAVVAIQIFDHLLDREAKALLGETARVLKPGGRLFASFMTTNTTRKSRIGWPLEGEAQTVLVSSGNSAGEIHRFFGPEQLEAFLGAPFAILGSSTVTQRDDRTGETAEARYFVLEKSGGAHG